MHPANSSTEYHWSTLPEVKAILKLTGPILLTQLAQVGMGTIDTLMSGYVSTRDLAAVAIGSAIWTPIWLFLAGILVAMSPAIAKARAADKNNNALRSIVGSGVSLGVIAGTLLGILTAVIALLLPSLVDDAHTAHTAKYYLLAIAIAMPVSGIFLALRFHAEAVDQAHHVTRIMLAGLLLNIPVNAALIYGWGFLPELGGIGCGIGSAIVVCTMTIALLWDCRRYRARDFGGIRTLNTHTQFSVLANLSRVGLPIGVAIFFEISLFTAIALFLTDLVPVVVAGHQVALNVSSVTFMLPLSLGMALTVRVGHHLGRSGFSAARRTAWLGVKLNLLLAMINATIILLGADLIAGLYSPDPAVVAIGSALLIYAAVFQIPDSIQIAAAGSLRAYEDTFAVMLITFVSYWLIGFSTGWYLAYGLAEPMGAAGFWIGLIAGLSCAAIILAWRLRVIGRNQLVQSPDSCDNIADLP
ncbi:MAG: MATE family efflux transporter [Pseudomonadota bacterium]|nr:MATE family efflux transporter [Pseudomonadota bacterium]